MESEVVIHSCCCYFNECVILPLGNYSLQVIQILYSGLPQKKVEFSTTCTGSWPSDLAQWDARKYKKWFENVR